MPKQNGQGNKIKIKTNGAKKKSINGGRMNPKWIQWRHKKSRINEQGRKSQIKSTGAEKYQKLINRGRKIQNQINRGGILFKPNKQGQKNQENKYIGSKLRSNSTGSENPKPNSEFQMKGSFSICFYKPVFLRDKDKFLTKTTGSEVSQIITGL